MRVEATSQQSVEEELLSCSTPLFSMVDVKGCSAKMLACLSETGAASG